MDELARQTRSAAVASKADADRASARSGLVFALRLDAAGGARAVDWHDVETDPSGSAEAGDLWIHLDRSVPRVRGWLAGIAKLPPSVVHALLVETPRPKYERYRAEEGHPEGFLLVLRGVNLNPDSDPDDMVSLRMWADEHRLVSVRKRLVMSVRGVYDGLLKGQGPSESSDLIVRLASALLERMQPVIERLDAELTEVEESTRHRRPEELRETISDVRLSVIRLRRYLAPQRDALQAATADLPTWFPRAHRDMLKAAFQRTSRVVEDLEELRDRANVMHDDLSMRVAERMNKVSTQLTIVAAVFLPMGLIAGVWGMNVPLPLSEHPHGFAIVAAAMVLGGVVIYLLVRSWINGK